MITDKEVDDALDWLLKYADKAAEARADRVWMEETSKALKAKLMKESGESSLGAQEREALASDAYQTHLKGLRAAVYDDEICRLKRASKEALIEAWRTQSSNNRTLGKIG